MTVESHLQFIFHIICWKKGYNLKIYDPKVSKNKILEDLFNLNLIHKKIKKG